MKLERKRIFISELPETATVDDIKGAFERYGRVENVEIKERKELGPTNSSLFFSYVNIDIDQRELQKCFKDFSEGKCLGRYVMLQVARESFLDRIRREREENNPGTSIINTVNERKAVEVPMKISNEYIDEKKKETSISQENELDYVIKDNRNKSRQDVLKIKSVGQPPIHVQVPKVKPNDPSNEANRKRLESLKVLKQNYQQQKTVIKAALCNVDTTYKKVIFDNDHVKVNEKKSLFNGHSEDEEDSFEGDFAVKEQFLGDKGQKLLELQSRYKNDKRFRLDDRFVENEEEAQNKAEKTSEDSLEEEKNKQLEILEEIFGSKSAQKTKQSNTKTMLRFDPSEPEHSKFEISKGADTNKKNRKKEGSSDVKKSEETETPVVSKEIFYKVNENIENSLRKNDGFSLLDTFGVAEVTEKSKEETTVETKQPRESFSEPNPFKYDSSEDEGETVGGFSESQGPKFTWTESLFFTEDDYRLQEGSDFVEKIKNDDQDQDFVKLRRDLKQVIRAKVRNNVAKKRPFKRKLGGSGIKKVKRIKKALKK